jgi:hypothetical protein
MKKFKVPFLVLVLLSATSCQNVFKNTANKTTDEAYYEDAQKAMDALDWDEAISKFASMGAEFKSRPTVIEQWAGAYAGKCGLNFISYFGNLGSSSLTGSTLFKYFMNQFTGISISPQHCSLAQSKMEELGATSAERTSSQNLFMAILGMVKVGAYLRSIADVDGTDNLGDGTADYPAAPSPGTYDSCDPAILDNDSLNGVITGMGLITNNITYLTVALGGSAGDIGTALDDLAAVCAGGACGKTDVSTVDVNDRDTFRDLLKTGTTNPSAPMGIEACVDPAILPCCPVSGG